VHSNRDMRCHTPNCTGEHQAGTISHSVLYRERTIVIHGVPASICPECGDVALQEETTIVLGDLLKRKARSKQTAFHYGT
jgi:YgiT-type zinc finger domain-containing protein